MTHVVIKTHEAEEDLLDIGEFIAIQSNSLEIGEQFIDRINKAIELLATQPHMGAARDDLETGLRFHPFENYLIFYRPTDSGIEVARVLHSKRNVESIFH